MRWLSLTLVGMIVAGQPAAAEITSGESVAVSGAVAGPLDVSGIGIVGPTLVIGSDETTSIQLLVPAGANAYEAHSPLLLLPGDDEIDIEGIASDGGYVYVVGSHSLIRKKVRPDKTEEKNHDRLLDVEHQESRDHIFRLRLTGAGALAAHPESIGLRKLLKKDELFAPFTRIPGKENGVDIEGIAVHKRKVYCGFRGPVFRGNFAPVLVFRFDEPEEYEVRFVNLGGLGIRDITRASDAFLIIAGPVGDGPGGYKLYAWDGKDGLLGSDVMPKPPELLGDVPTPAGAKAEGIVVTGEADHAYDVIVVYDGVDKGGLTRMHVTKAE
jgi:hypothetical protein